ncbi:MAG: EF-hand domain-containing protein [Aestuariivirgaceae bacterium]
MQKRTKIILASATAGLIGLVAVGAAVADHRHKERGWGGHHGSYGMHRGGWGRHGGRHGMRGRVRSFLKRYDADKNGEITQQEIDTNRNDWHKKFDTDGNGTLTMQEFEALWLEAKRRRMVRSFQRLDEDGSGTVTLDEYTEPMANFVERMDRNGDGVLSRKDRRHHRRMDRKGRRGGGDGQRMRPSQETDDL